jgi:ArsR family transcriptional regulator
LTEYEKSARIFKAFCDGNRWRILRLLQGGELCACKLLEELDIGQPTLSHHMKVLCDAGVVTGRREGKWTHYSLNPQGLAAARQLLEALSPSPEGEDLR